MITTEMAKTRVANRAERAKADMIAGSYMPEDYFDGLIFETEGDSNILVINPTHFFSRTLADSVTKPLEEAGYTLIGYGIEGSGRVGLTFIQP